MKDLGVMVVGLRKSQDEDEREKGVQLLVRVTCKRELFTPAQCDKAKKWEMELQGTRLRQATRQVQLRREQKSVAPRVEQQYCWDIYLYFYGSLL